MKDVNSGRMSDFEACFNSSEIILTEGAIGLRLMNEFNIVPDAHIAYAGPLYQTDEALVLGKLYRQYMDVAQKYGLPILVSTPTRRSNKERISASQYCDKSVIHDSVNFLKNIREEYSLSKGRIFIAGLMGCKGDAYNPAESLETDEAFAFHSWQAQQFREAGADCLFAGIMPALPEAIGMAKAMEATVLPYVISFMIRGTGYLMDGTSISDAILSIDAATQRNPLCYMVNCIHPTILTKALENPMNLTDTVRTRFAGIQANASALSPEELNCSDCIVGDAPEQLAEHMLSLYGRGHLRIFGGCCGTDDRHMDAIAKVLARG